MPEVLTPAEPVEQPAESAAPETVSADLSLADHEAAFGPPDPSLEGEEKVQADEKREKIRHRAKSQIASPDDVVTIQKLSARAKAAEDAAGIARNAGESERVYRLRVRAELAERYRQAPASQPAPTQQPAAQVQRHQQGQQQPAFEPTRPKPTEDEVGEKYPTYAEFTEDLARWVWEQNSAAWQQQEQQRQHQEAANRAQQDWNQKHQTYYSRVAEFTKTHPDFDTLLEPIKSLDIPPAVYAAIIRADNGPAFMYHLLQHPAQLAEMLTIWDEKPASDHHVANATRWLSSRVQAGTTGSAVSTPPQQITAPRPPNPVRTGPMKTGEELPGDDASLADHERAFGKRRKPY